jgi:hypothetical protein
MPSKKAAAPAADAKSSEVSEPAAMSKSKAKAAVVDFIVKNPTASDQTVAAEVGDGVNTDFVQEVRDAMGARHTWPKAKED